MIEMENVRKVYGNSNTVALNGVDLRVDEGEFVFLVGPSGSGKTTLMKLITGEIRPTSGKVIVNDYDMAKIRRHKLPKMRRTLGVIFQDFRLIDNMNVYDNVAFAMRVVGARNRDIRKRVPYVLELVGLDGRERRLPSELSGGEQQRVAIARALVNNPRMIVADEPTGNLDPVRSLELMLLFEKINEIGTTILVVTHEKELVNAFGKRVVAIENGVVVSDAEGGYFDGRQDKGRHNSTSTRKAAVPAEDEYDGEEEDDFSVPAKSDTRKGSRVQDTGDTRKGSRVQDTGDTRKGSRVQDTGDTRKGSRAQASGETRQSSRTGSVRGLSRENSADRKQDLYL